jgi:hypothetical protein
LVTGKSIAFRPGILGILSEIRGAHNTAGVVFFLILYSLSSYKTLNTNAAVLVFSNEKVLRTAFKGSKVQRFWVQRFRPRDAKSAELIEKQAVNDAGFVKDGYRTRNKEFRMSKG